MSRVISFLTHIQLVLWNVFFTVCLKPVLYFPPPVVPFRLILPPPPPLIRALILLKKKLIYFRGGSFRHRERELFIDSFHIHRWPNLAHQVSHVEGNDLDAYLSLVCMSRKLESGVELGLKPRHCIMRNKYLNC